MSLRHFNNRRMLSGRTRRWGPRQARRTEASQNPTGLSHVSTEVLLEEVKLGWWLANAYVGGPLSYSCIYIILHMSIFLNGWLFVLQLKIGEGKTRRGFIAPYRKMQSLQQPLVAGGYSSCSSFILRAARNSHFSPSPLLSLVQSKDRIVN